MLVTTTQGCFRQQQVTCQLLGARTAQLPELWLPSFARMSAEAVDFEIQIEIIIWLLQSERLVAGPSLDRLGERDPPAAKLRRPPLLSSQARETLTCRAARELGAGSNEL